MVDSLFNDSSIKSLSLALDGLAQRQQLISRNLANVDTPGYQAQTIDFKTAIRNAMDSSGGMRLASTQAGHISANVSTSAGQVTARMGGSPRADGNNVDVDTELLDMTETGIQFQALSQGISKKLLLLKAITESR
ncbi:MAG: flagellar basal body rod protein FlgB [Anaerolineaceae bacterium]|nr:flagellar basal body rod protein FlgB [Anaerolineaceae bacterium]